MFGPFWTLQATLKSNVVYGRSLINDHENREYIGDLKPVFINSNNVGSSELKNRYEFPEIEKKKNIWISEGIPIWIFQEFL